MGLNRTNMLLFHDGFKDLTPGFEGDKIKR